MLKPNPDSLIAEIRELRASRDAALERAFKAEQAQAERDALRLIVTEKFARDVEVAVKPEDAADVAKWARNPEAVRELLKLQPYRAVMDEPYLDDDDQCAGCEARAADPHSPDCRVFLAWAALDDPRAAEAIGAAFDRARPVRHDGGWVGTALHAAEAEEMVTVRLSPPGPLADLSPFASPAAFRLASESEECGAALPPSPERRSPFCTLPLGHGGQHGSESEQATDWPTTRID